MIELALAFNDIDGSYAAHAAVVLSSVFRNTKSQMNIHILHDETLSEENKQKLVKLTTNYKHDIHFYPITFSADFLEASAGVSAIGKWTMASMYRLLLPTLIPASKVIYLDCDVLVNMDIKELWETDLGSYYLAAVQDQGVQGVADMVIACGLNPENYFNSGVILFGLDNIRQKMNWHEDMLNFLRNFPMTAMPDQDVLNSGFGGNYLPLDERYNFTNSSGNDHDLNHKIIHFAGEVKGWDAHSPGYHLYQEYFNLTPWMNHTIGHSVKDKVKRKITKSKSKGKTVGSRFLGLKGRRVRKSTLGKLRLARRSKIIKTKKRTKMIWTPLNKITPVKRRKTRKLIVPRTRRKVLQR
ncbi:hypothetical protein BVG16_13235 [Paenibacillus selenitireducens]|uniref:Glycosyl transferase n=1 Tax=Paenibacillus selenitireducens TaxID=1324314 RepID=A0A1T2XC63_9BACL|nr:glycosyltransferase family 8 protein [Paenibacillus selenitireducens]OPA77418.1 hypothetical protein BVG16_13235 [Paenibacillus selenitireducens]